MQRTIVLIAAGWMGCVLLGSPVQAQWGDLVGKFVVDGKAPAQKKTKVTKDNADLGNEVIDDQLRVDATGGVADVVVYIRSKVEKIHESYDKAGMAVIDNKGGRFVPHVVPVYIKKQTLVIGNPDKVAHNSNLQPPGDKGENPLIPSGGMHNFKFGRQQNYPVPITCNIHPWMKGFVLPRDNPYMAVSAEDGTFVIKNIPVGEHEFLLWHDPKILDLKGTDKGKIKIKIAAGDNHLPMADKEGVVKVDVKLLEAK